MNIFRARTRPSHSFNQTESVEGMNTVSWEGDPGHIITGGHHTLVRYQSVNMLMLREAEERTSIEMLLRNSLVLEYAEEKACCKKRGTKRQMEGLCVNLEPPSIFRS